MVVFAVNGEEFKLGQGVDLSVSLNEWLRTSTKYKGTKLGCGEGGCGACAVEVSRFDAVLGKVTSASINSCLSPLGLLDGAAITTAEGIGNSQTGYHPIQERIAAFHGSQCGYCTPGIVVACHAELERCREQGVPPTQEGLTKGLDGNLCRCTGYRPILDACKSLVDGVDIEDLGINPFCGAIPTALLPDAPEFPDFLARQPVAHAATHHFAGGRVWEVPTDLRQLLCLLESHKDRKPRLVAGNTGPGVYKDWPHDDVIIDVQHVKELRAIEVNKDEAVVGGAVTLSELIRVLQSSDAANPEACRHMADHLLLIAGWHVRNAATLGGHFALVKSRELESDALTVLWAAGASISLASSSGERWLSLDEFMAAEDLELGVSQVVTAVKVPLPRQGDLFWSHKVSPRFWNAHSLMNAAVSLRTRAVPEGSGVEVEAARVVFGFFDNPATSALGSWRVGRVEAAEDALSGHTLDVGTLVAALEAVKDHAASVSDSPYNRGTAEGLLLSALAPLITKKDIKSAELGQLLEVHNTYAPLRHGARHDVPEGIKQFAPVGEPVEKDRIGLQTSGEAIYTSDITMPQGGLYAAFVNSTEALACIEAVDPSPALELAGVVRFVCASDIPKRGRNAALDDVLFAEDRVVYYGQRIGLVLATSQTAAERAVKLVKVTYSKPESLGKPVLSIADAKAVGSYYPANQLKCGECKASTGDVEAALKAAKHTIRGARFEIGSQQHFYMECQAALAIPDEDDRVVVHSATQNVDTVQGAVGRLLGLPSNKVTVKVRRVGGAFGGKSSRSLHVGAAAALAAVTTGRPVRLVVNRNEDMRMNGGRDETEVEYDVGFDDDGRISGVDIRAVLLGGGVKDLADDDMACLKAGIDIAYDFPNMRVECRLARTNLAPRTIVRGPGFLQACMVTEQVVEHVASYLGLDPAVVKERNFLKPSHSQDPGLPSGPHFRPCMKESALSIQLQAKAEAALAAAAAVTGSEAAAPAADAPPLKNGFTMRTPLGQEFSTDLYTLPRIWSELMASSSYEERVAEVQRFNEEHVWRKRGIATAVCRFDCAPPPITSQVNVYADGSVLVCPGGMESGQGLATKVKQMAAFALGQALPEAERPFPLERIAIGDNSTVTTPNCGSTWSSTSSEGACEATRLACEQLVGRLAPIVEEHKGWDAAVASLYADEFSPAQVLLTGYGFFDGSERNPDGGQTSGKQLSYVAFGAAVTEVEVDVLTGEKTVRRTDINFDCGHSLNPAVDMGQVEGAFIQGAGLQLQEEVVVDPATGRLLTDGTWLYKIPTAACIPQQLNVTFLKDSPNPRGIMSSKATGEPSLMLSTSILAALRAAASAAHADKRTGGEAHADASAAAPSGGDSFRPLFAPVTGLQLKQAYGEFSIAGAIRAAAGLERRTSSGAPPAPGSARSSGDSWVVLTPRAAA